MELKGYQALVCGASKGIGRAIAEQLAVSGAEICLVARDQKALSEVEQNLKGQTKVESIALDLSDTAKIRERLSGKPFQIVVNNTGGPAAGPLLEATAEQLLSAFQQHIIAAQTLAQLFVPGMKERRFGRIINIISTSVKVPIPNLGVSNTIRGAMASWAKTLATELGPFGITVNNVLPGYTSTERLDVLRQNSAAKQGVSPEQIREQWLSSIPAGRFATPLEIAQAAKFLALPASAYINGINLPVDGGRTGTL